MLHYSLSHGTREENATTLQEHVVSGLGGVGLAGQWDRVAIKFSSKILELSHFLKTTVEDMSSMDDPLDLDVSEVVLNWIKEFLEHYNFNAKAMKTIQKPLKTSNFEELTDTFSNNFLKSKTHQQIADLMMGTSYLQCQILFDYCCAFVASYFRDKTIDELKTEFNITEELTPELEEQIKKDNAYLFQGIIPSQE